MNEEKKSKAKLFAENMLVYGLGGIISKLIPVIMVPIITRIMPSTEYFGISDLSNTLISIASTFAILGMYDGLFRIYFEKDDNDYRISTCSTALCFTTLSSIIVSVLMILFRTNISSLFFHDCKFTYIVDICAVAVLVSTTNRIVAAPTRMQNKRIIYLVVNTISPIISYMLAVPLILKGHYTIALPLAAVISGAIIEGYYYSINRKWFKLGFFKSNILKQMLIVALPLVPNILIYWVFNSSDRLMITNMIGLGEEGVYSIGAKLGHCSQLIYTAFSGGWSYFVFSTMKDDDQIRYNSKIFEYLGVVSFVSTISICVITKPLYILLFPTDYHAGFIVAPYLFLAPLLQMLFQVSASQFTIVKKTWNNMIILSFGAVINVLLNSLFIPLVGIEGAAMATLFGYSISVSVCLVVLVNKRLFLVTKRFICSAILMVTFFVIWRFVLLDNVLMSAILAILFLVAYCILYRHDLIIVYKQLKIKAKA